MMPATAYEVPMASFESRWVDHDTPATPSDGVVTITHTHTDHTLSTMSCSLRAMIFSLDRDDQ